MEQVNRLAWLTLALLTVAMIMLGAIKVYRLMDAVTAWYVDDTGTVTCPTYHQGDDIRLGAQAQ